MFEQGDLAIVESKGMVAQAKPSFGDPEYWQSRFSDSQGSFDWLQDGRVFDEPLQKLVENSESNGKTKILHIGCGSSLLSQRICQRVHDPAQIFNIDVSPAAVQLGKKLEQKGETGAGMHWEVLDLLDSRHVQDFAISAGRGFEMVIDKSTSDAVACAEDILIEWPHILPNVTERRSLPELISPLTLLAVHLAFLCKPSAVWLVLSYSSQRFPFLVAADASESHNESDTSRHQSPLASGIPNPAQLWELVSHTAVAAPSEESSDDVHRPVISHHFYTLRRTAVELQLEISMETEG